MLVLWHQTGKFHINLYMDNEMKEIERELQKTQIYKGNDFYKAN